MRIAFVSYEFPPDTGKGGIGTYISQTAAALAENNDIHVFAGGSITESLFRSGYHLHKIKCNNGTDFREKVLPVFTSVHNIIPFEIIESPEINGNAWEIKKRFTDLTLVVRLHAPDHLVESLKKKYIPFLAKLRFFLGALRRFRLDLGYWRKYNKNADRDYQFIQLADHITAPSEAMKNWAVNNWNILPDKIKVIPNLFIPDPNLLAIPINKEVVFKRIVFFGRLNVLKGLVNASIAMKKILTEFPDWKFRVIGDNEGGPTAGTGMKEWMQMKLSNVTARVEFLDGMEYEALPDAIKDAEIVLLPSLFESFSYTCIEAMAAGKAIVGSNKGGMYDLLQNESGSAVDPENPDGIYRALMQLIADNSFRYKTSLNARARVLTEYDTAKVLKEYQLFYEGVK